ncbi:MAG: VanW family protein [Candidatus Paceibacterota bacterium]
MLKHRLHKYLNKKSRRKKHIHKAPEKISEEPVTKFVVFGLSIFGFLAILVPLLLSTYALCAFEIKYSDRFYPGVLVNGEKVGGQSYVEALNHFKEKSEELKNNGLSINFENLKGENKKVNIPMSVPGLTADNSIEYFTINDWENDLQKAYKWGRGINIFRSSIQQISLLFTRKNFDFSTVIQEEAINSLIESELNNFLKKSVSAEFSLVNNKVIILKEKVGEVVNKEEIFSILRKKLSQFDTSTTIFKVSEDISVIREENLSNFLDFVNNFGKKINLVFKYKGYKWNIKGGKLVTWFIPKEDTGISINRKKLEDYFSNNVNRFIENPPRNSRFEVQNGKIVETVLGKTGNVINIEKIIQQIETIITEAEENSDFINNVTSIPIEIIQVEPKITKDTILKYQIKDLVGEIRTNFSGSSADREHNIKIGVSTITGMLIAPGEEFSTVSSIGPVTEKEGYLKELVIKENKTTKEFGGGLCQIATTLFRLALNAGLPITERMNHRFVVHYYDPPGLDATIYGPHPDFRFVNDTESYLLLQASVENKEVIMQLYGHKDGRSVEISEPTMYNKIPAPPTRYVKSRELFVGQTKCSETPHDGLTTDVLYTVNYPDGTVKKRNFKSIYQPWQKVCLIGTALFR